MAGTRKIGANAVATKGVLKARQWLLLRRLSQMGVLLAFLAGPWLGLWLIKGNIAASRILDTVPLTDPLLMLQTVMAGHPMASTALTGAALVLGFYLLVGGRVYCGWVCPINPVTDLAHWLRERLKLTGGIHLSRQARYGVLAMVLLLPLSTGSLAWELVNPVTLSYRGLVFGLGLGWGVLLVLFLTDLLLGRRLWCGHLCPVGAFYGLLGRAAVLRISASRRDACDDCMDCYAVCPEPQVIRPALKGAGAGRGPVILDGACSNCGRCIDVCAQDVFHFSTRFHNHPVSRGMPENGGLVP